jgi:hypothetical protein
VVLRQWCCRGGAAAAVLLRWCCRGGAAAVVLPRRHGQLGTITRVTQQHIVNNF